MLLDSIRLSVSTFILEIGKKNPVPDFLSLKVKVLVAQSGLTLCDPMNCSPPGSSVHVILQARILSGLLFPSLGNLPNPETEAGSPTLQADSSLSEPSFRN